MAEGAAAQVRHTNWETCIRMHTCPERLHAVKHSEALNGLGLDLQRRSLHPEASTPSLFVLAVASARLFTLLLFAQTRFAGSSVSRCVPFRRRERMCDRGERSAASHVPFSKLSHCSGAAPPPLHNLH